MDQHRRREVFTELVEMSEELVGEILQKLSYYRASVYKGEAADSVKQSIEKLRKVADYLADCHPAFMDVFADYDALAANPEVLLARYPGECTLSLRVLQLTQDIKFELQHIEESVLSIDHHALEELRVLRPSHAKGMDI